MEERREHGRYSLWLPIQIEADGLSETGPSEASQHPSLAMAQNISVSGMRIAVSSELKVGQAVAVRFRVPSAPSEEHHLKACVIRVEPNADDPEGMWPYRAALRFDRPADDIVTALAEMS